MEPSNNNFEGFGDAFEGFPKHLPDDCVEYSLFIIDARINSQKELLSRLEAVRKEASRLTDSLLKDYIWQRDEFGVGVKNTNGLIYLHGLTNYGDSVDDEWLIVYILKELSKQFPELWVKVVDTDGEFLLIEAANALPRWLNPEIADNRVWIHNDALRIIPLRAESPTSSNTTTTTLSRSLRLDEAHRIITSNSNILIHSPLIEAEAFYRLRGYPTQISESLHYALVTIPRKLAFIIHGRPASIAPATEAFYLRDPIALKPLQSTTPSLIFAPEDLTTVSIRFTRVLYAQLKSQRFTPPIVWKEILLQAEKGASSSDVKQKEYDRLEMGMKITSGFEMLFFYPKNSDNRLVREIKILLEDLQSGDETLPTDIEISKWKDATREDDEKWLDINFEDFEKELGGKHKEIRTGIPGSFGPEPPSGFGDAKTRADLKKMVERFEAFLNDDEAGIDGAEMDDMDFDDDEDSASDEDSEDEDKDVSFDEKEFARMMGEMMGMPSEDEETTAVQAMNGKASQLGENNRAEVDTHEDGDEEEARQIQDVMKRMEAELNEAGALSLDPPSEKSKGKEKIITQSENKDDWEDESDNGEINIDFNLAKNLLESFKSQAGMPGPSGNIMGMMGMHLPRDEDEGMASKIL
ncbi:SGT1 protein-domain-containing protein [Tricladium varicosporioides]|nr:SGT1 protein-domain-containing protein [Hymenoscyphus varicosporioides]